MDLLKNKLKRTFNRKKPVNATSSTTSSVNADLENPLTASLSRHNVDPTTPLPTPSVGTTSAIPGRTQNATTIPGTGLVEDGATRIIPETQGSPRERPKGTGLYILCESPGAEIDVVAVHGLNPKNNSNHAFDTWTKGNTLWLRDMLPERLSKPVRVMLFAYNSSPAINASAIKLDDHSRNLLQWLSSKRPQKHHQRPLVFICHSLGGLVVKQALVEAKLDESYTSIIKSTRLLVFFGCPHQGGNHATFGDILTKMLKMAPGKPSNDLIKALKKNSDAAMRRVEQGRQVFEEPLVLSFFEGKPYGNLGIIVDKTSSTLNLPGSREKQVALDADHSDICKFEPNDNMGTLVLDTIEMEAEKSLNMDTEQNS